MKNLFKIIVFVLPATFLFPSCEKDKQTIEDPGIPTPIGGGITPVTVTGSMKIEFHNMVDGETLQFDKTYKNPNGESYTVSKFNYYISNIVLTKNDNSQISIANQYQIINHSDDTSRVINLSGIPVGSYKAVKLLLGVDSARNNSGAQTGGLSATYAHKNDMYWDWNQGYIFLKLEGTAPDSPTTDIAFHMGGARGTYKAQREFNIDFIASEATVAKSSTPTLYLTTNVNEMFKTPTLISFVTNNQSMSPGTKISKTIADNYADMIKFESIKN